MASLKAPVVINVDFNPQDLVKSIGETHLQFLSLSLRIFLEFCFYSLRAIVFSLVELLRIKCIDWKEQTKPTIKTEEAINCTHMQIDGKRQT